jgi:micrococcal nuclease
MVRSRTVVVVSVLAAASVLGWWFGEQRRAVSQEYRVVQVFDGDTIVVQRGEYRDTIRLLGVDTPETHHPTKPVQCYGPEASAYTT